MSRYDTNLDVEFRRMVEEYGWWMVLRSFNLTTRSQYWDDRSKEAIGGPAWKYNDIIFKGRRVEHVQGDTETFEMRQQFTDVPTVVFYVLSRLRPKKEDELVEILPNMRFTSKPPRNVRAYEVFDIKHVELKIEKGIVFSKCYAQKKTPTNDVTYKDSFPVKYMPTGIKIT